MKKIVLHIILLLLMQTAIAQIMPNYYPSLESNRPKGNKYLFYRMYATSTSTNPNSAAELEASYLTAANYRASGYVTLASNAGNLNSSISSTNNILNYTSYTQLQTAIGTQTPYAGFNGQGYSMAISGYFIPKQTGTYTFSMEGDDAVDLFINDQFVASHYGSHAYSPIGTHTGTIALVAGKKYLFRVRMTQGGGGDALLLFWKKPSESGSSTWYQDIEELSGEEAVPNGLVFSVDPANWYTYPKYGTSVYDLKGSTTGTIGANMSYNTSNGGIFYSDGDQDYIDFGKTPANFPTGDISVFVWLKASSLRNGWNIFLTKWFADVNNGGGADFHYDIYPNGSYYYQNLYTTNKSNMFGINPLSINTWYQVGFTISGGNLQMYLNGSTDGSIFTNAGRTNYIQSSLWLCDARSGGGLDFNGYIGSIQIYNRAISADEVFQNYNATKHKYGL